MQYIHYILIFKVHHNACRPFTQDGHHTTGDIFNWGYGVDISFAELVVDVGGTSTVNVIRKKGSSVNIPLLPKAFPLSPLLGTKSVTQ